MRRLCLALAAAAALSAPVSAETRSYTVDGRTFSVQSPDRLGRRPAPLVIALHGGGGNARRLARDLPLAAEAERTGFRLVYLDGTSAGRRLPRNMRAWNAGDCCGLPAESGVDDVAYVTGVIDRLVRDGLADPRRVILVGHSNGAMMAYRLVCEGGGRIRGAIIASGALVRPVCADARGVDVIHLHSEGDPTLPVAGGRGARGAIIGVDFPSLDTTLERVRAGGARVEVRLLEGDDHGIAAMAENLRAQAGISFQRLLGAFVRAH